MGERRINPRHNIFKQYKKVNLVNPFWFSKPFESTWRTSSTSAGSSTATQVKLPLISTGTYNFVVNWGDGNTDTITVWNQAQVTHTYSIAGDYTIKINGTCTGWQFNNTGDRLKIRSVSSWGKLKLGTTQGGYFYGCSNLNLSSVSDILDLTGTTNLTSTFNGCSSLTSISRANEWNVSSATIMTSMFNSATLFNQNIGSWNVSNVTTFASMFVQSSFNNGGSSSISAWVIKSTGTVAMNSMFQEVPFNQPIGSWNVSAVTTISNMFSGGTSTFNQNIGSWNVSNVTDMSNIFNNNPVFNQNIGSWNVSNVTNFTNMFACASAISTFNNGGSSDINNWTLKSTGSILMNSMFRSARAFNQPLNLWNTVRVTDMTSMFQSAIIFNQNIGNWNVSNVTTFVSMFQSATAFNNGGSNAIGNWTIKSTPGTVNMSTMFQSAVNFNQPIGNWTGTAGILSISSMFNSATIFNQPLNTWDTSNITSMNSAFQGTSTFNQNIGSWNVSNVTTFASMFFNATAFNQNIGSWNVANGTNFTSFMLGKTPSTFSSTNLDAIYNGWSLNTVKPNVNISFGTAKYTASGVSGRAILTGAPNNWTITDGGI